MHRIDSAGATVGNLFTDGNPVGPVPATVVDADWLNDVQENIVQMVEAAGIVLTKGDYTQLLKAIVTKGLQGCYFNISGAAGTADAVIASYSPAITALANGMTLYVRAASANATTTPTFTPNSGTIAAKTIVKGAGSALVAGDIAGAGHWIELQYDLTLDKWVLLNPATGVVAGGISASANNTFTKAQRGAVVAQADGATITPDFALGNNYEVTLAGNRTLANPTNLVAGQSGVIKITQDATGSRTLSYGAYFKFAGGAAPTLTTTANAVDVLAYYVESATRITARLIRDVK